MATFSELMQNTSMAVPQQQAVPVAQSGKLAAEASAFKDLYPGLSLSKSLDAASAAQSEAAQKQQLIKSMAGDLQSKNYQGALAKYAQLDPEGVKSLLPQLSKIDPKLAESLALGEAQGGTQGQYNVTTAYGSNPRQLLDARLNADKNITKMQLEARQSASAGEDFTPGEKALDQAFAKDYAEYIKAGGAAKVEKSLKNLNVAENLFLKGKGASTGLISKVFASFAPDAAQNLITPDVAKARDNIRDTVNQSLRTILGAQFTDKEGERLIQNTFNPSLGPKENLRRLEVLKQSIVETARTQQQAIDYFRKNRTLRGYEGPMPGAITADELTNTLIEKVNTPANPTNSAIPETGAEMDGYVFLGGNPADPKSWRKK